MENCLVTKLKESVNNENLRKLGMFYIDILPTENNVYNRIILGTTCPVASPETVNAINGQYFGDSEDTVETQKKTTANFDNQHTFVGWYRNAKGRYEIVHKYNIREIDVRGASSTRINYATFDIGELKFISTLQTLNTSHSKVKGDITSLVNHPNLVSLICNNCDIYGDISVLATCPNLTTVTLSFHTTGDIASLANKTNFVQLIMTNSAVSGVLSDLNKMTSLRSVGLSENISGMVEDFVSGQITNGRNTVTSSNAISIIELLRYCTFGGNNYNQAYAFVTWESASKIAIYSGGSTIANCTTVYTKGYTAEEAASAFPGKTIVRVDA